MSKEMIILVDEKDQPQGLMEKMEAHEKGLLHRAFSVFLLRKKNNKIELLLQQRNFEKYHCGGLWTNTCCSHPRDGETTVQAGQRRVQEELGVTCHLQEVGAFMYRAEFANGLTEHEFDHVLIGGFNAEEIPFNPDEVANVRWIGLEDLYLEMSAEPAQFTPWFKPALDIVQRSLSKHEDVLPLQAV